MNISQVNNRRVPTKQNVESKGSVPASDRNKEARKRQLRERISRLNEEISRLKERKGRAKSEVSRLGEQIQRLESRIYELDGKIHSKGLEIARLEGKRAGLKEKKRQTSDPDEKYRLQERIWRLTDSIQSKSDERYRLRESRSSAVDSKGSKRNRKQDLEYKISDISEDLRDCERQRTDAKEELRRLESPWGLNGKPTSKA